MKKFILSLSFIFIISLVVGCAPKDRRCVVSGTITSDGQPLPTGVVNFSPIDPDPTKSVVGASADIVNGQYAISPETGLLAGKYKVTVNCIELRHKKTGEFVDPYDVKDGKIEPTECEDVDLVPPKFGRDSEVVLEVGNQKTMTFDITMVSE